MSGDQLGIDEVRSCACVFRSLFSSLYQRDVKYDVSRRKTALFGLAEDASDEVRRAKCVLFCFGKLCGGEMRTVKCTLSMGDNFCMAVFADVSSTPTWAM